MRPGSCGWSARPRFVIQLPFILETLLATLLGAGLGFGALWAAIRFGITENVAKSIPITFITTHDVVSITPGWSGAVPWSPWAPPG